MSGARSPTRASPEKPLPALTAWGVNISAQDTIRNHLSHAIRRTDRPDGIIWEGSGAAGALPMVRVVLARFPDLREVGFHRDFHSPAGLLRVNTLRKKE